MLPQETLAYFALFVHASSWTILLAEDWAVVVHALGSI